MTRSKLSSKVPSLVIGVGLVIAAFAGSQSVPAQAYNCPAGTLNDPTYGCTSNGWAAGLPYDYGHYGYPYYGYPYGYSGYPYGYSAWSGGFVHGMAGGLGGLQGGGGGRR